ncbi:MAG TPA: metal-dependent hydrolase [Gemmatimonadota bacterium]|nr:metal-dependent hydrolase [Gemmatimonadota bacterium]
MDNVSHTLTGWALARAAGTSPPPGTTLALVLASNLPDIDLVLQARSDAAYILFHRGLTHSLVGLVVLPIALAAGLWWAYGGRTRFAWLALISAAGVAMHLVYDLVTPWGTMLLYPFSSERFALEWLFIVDFVTWALPAGVLVVSRRRAERGRAAVVVWLLALFVYGAAAAGIHRQAVSVVVASERAQGRQVAEAVAFPRLGAPWRWSGIAVGPLEAPEPRIAVHRMRGIPPRATRTERIDRRFDDPWVARALATREGQAYLWWARVPVADVARTNGLAVVTLRDLRFARAVVPAAESWTPFAIRFRFDERSGRLIDVTW